MKSKQVIKIIIFLAVLLIISFSVYNVLSWKDTKGMRALYNCPEDSIDVLFIGSSHSYCTINTAMLWEDYGIACEDISESGQTFATEYYYLKEALKTQHPKVVFAELRGIDMPYNTTNGNIYRNTLSMKWSADYYHNMNAVLEGIGGNDTGLSQLETIKKAIVFKFPVVHTRYNELTQDDFDSYDRAIFRFSSNWSKKVYEVPAALKETGTTELTDVQKRALEQMIDLSKEHDFRLVLWVAPYIVDVKKMKQFHAVEQYALERNVDYYGIQQVIEETGFDFKNDMRNEKTTGSHVNNYGAEKVTRYFGDLLKQKYGIQDHRGGSGYSYFDQMAREWDIAKGIHSLESAGSLQEYISVLDHSLFEACAIDLGGIGSYGMGHSGQEENEVHNENLIVNADTYKDWFTDKQDYISYLDDGTVCFSAADLSRLSYSRIEGPVNAELSDIMNGDDYILSFEVMSPDWSAVSEPTTDYKGLNAAAVTFVTSDGSPVGKQLAYRFFRLGNRSSSIWREIPTPVDGQWMKYVSVPLKFTSTSRTWSDIDKGIGEYLRVGPSLRANGTVYFRNFRFEKCDRSNDWGAAVNAILKPIGGQRGEVAGLTTSVNRNSINGAWELSDQVRLTMDGNDIANTKLYDNSKEVIIGDCDLCIVVLDRETGKLVRKDEFTLSGDRILKK